MFMADSLTFEACGANLTEHDGGWLAPPLSSPLGAASGIAAPLYLSDMPGNKNCPLLPA